MEQLGRSNRFHKTPIFIWWPFHFPTDTNRKRLIGKKELKIPMLFKKHSFSDSITPSATRTPESICKWPKTRPALWVKQLSTTFPNSNAFTMRMEASHSKQRSTNDFLCWNGIQSSLSGRRARLNMHKQNIPWGSKIETKTYATLFVQLPNQWRRKYSERETQIEGNPKQLIQFFRLAQSTSVLCREETFGNREHTTKFVFSSCRIIRSSTSLHKVSRTLSTLQNNRWARSSQTMHQIWNASGSAQSWLQ